MNAREILKERRFKKNQNKKKITHVFIDEDRFYNKPEFRQHGLKFSRMWSPNRDYLEKFANEINLAQELRLNDCYLLPSGKRERALLSGAIEITTEQLEEKMKAK
jgi:hypothetical protein